MKKDTVRSIIIGNIEAVDQGVRIVNTLNDQQYCFNSSQYFNSSIGQHFRHIIDMFRSVTQPQEPGLIDYDVRRRGADIEKSRTLALQELGDIKIYLSTHLANLDQALGDLHQEIDLKTEVTIEETHSVILRSTLLRELVFIGSHAVHHYALISMIAKIQGVVLEEAVGVAPATATFLRCESAAAIEGANTEALEAEKNMESPLNI